jgi:hypothetical protein
MGIKYTVVAVNLETSKHITQTFNTSAAALKIRDLLSSRGYTAAVRTDSTRPSA